MRWVARKPRDKSRSLARHDVLPGINPGVSATGALPGINPGVSVRQRHVLPTPKDCARMANDGDCGRRRPCALLHHSSHYRHASATMEFWACDCGRMANHDWGLRL